MSIAEKFETVADRVYEKGQQNATDDFIKRFTNNGARTNYTYGFCSMDFSGFTIEATPKNIGYLFSYYEGKTIPDGIDCSNASTTGTSTNNSPAYLCAYSKLKYLPDINIPPAHYWYASFRDCTELETIEVIRMREGSGASTNVLFLNCNSLKNITFEGVIPITIGFADCPLTVTSIKSIIEHLQDYSGTSNANSYTVTFKAPSSSYKALSELEAEGATAEYNGQPCTWLELIAYKKWKLG